MQQELRELSLRYGQPLEVCYTLDANTYLATRGHQVSEVCLVLQRPGGRFLTLTKAFYPPGVYRLPTGRIEWAESITDALHREMEEGIGLEATILRYLAHLTYQHNEGRLFHSHVFLLAAEDTPRLKAPLEPIYSFREVSAQELLAIAQRLEQLPEAFSQELSATWADWGRFRAIVHRVAAQALSSPQTP
ncbi:NUDIX hydrolase [Meiothermus rufus]|uniref:NUDIX hydrolase n=1 Tax=Meiothermus rufus TaxID=604332 RepID=UPI0004062A07|nr:NUDIX hydrolase [Meiothermus rufus]